MTPDHASWGLLEDWALADLHFLATSCAMGLPDSCPNGFKTSAMPAPFVNARQQRHDANWLAVGRHMPVNEGACSVNAVSWLCFPIRPASTHLYTTAFAVHLQCIGSA